MHNISKLGLLSIVVSDGLTGKFYQNGLVLLAGVFGGIPGLHQILVN